MIEPGLEVLTCQMNALIAVSVESNEYQVDIDRQVDGTDLLCSSERSQIAFKRN
jgi:hypothetical protein